MTPAFRYTLLWLVGSMLMIFLTLTTLTMGYVDGHYIPGTPDSLYHARRVLDSLMSGAPIAQFDSKIHVPEGSWITWPWGYDTALVYICRLFGPFANEDAANRILMNIPPAASPIAIALVVTIARQLALPFALAVLLVLSFAALPIGYMHFAVGDIDHHFAELLWTLATYSAGLWFFRAKSKSYASGIVLGAVLGSALAIHNGLFILQIPIALALGYFWLRGAGLPERRQVIAFAASLFVTTLLVCIPSEPWQRGFFEFYTLSWFHFYVSACVAGFSVALVLTSMNRKGVVCVFLAALIALAPLVSTLAFAGEFVTAELNTITYIQEARSPYKVGMNQGHFGAVGHFTWLLWLTLPMLLLNMWWIWKARSAALQFAATMGALSLALLQMQYRFGIFGELAMLLTPLLAISSVLDSRPFTRAQWAAMIAACWALYAAAFYPAAGTWTSIWYAGSSPAYFNLRSAFPVLKELCRERPGIVLGDIDTGHWVRYHTDCPVIANVFLLTKQHAEKAFESARLMELSPAALVDANRNVRYVWAHHSVEVLTKRDKSESLDLDSLRQNMNPLETALLGPVDKIPPQYKLRWELLTPKGQVYSRIYEIVPDP
jgi:hypothetical protein